MDLTPVYSYIEANRDRFIEELRQLIRQPSISTQNKGVKECAELIRQMMERVGIEARIISTPGQPVVFGHLRFPGAAKTLLIYNHYDVQPVEPLEAWEHPPSFSRGRAETSEAVASLPQTRDRSSGT